MKLLRYQPQAELCALLVASVFLLSCERAKTPKETLSTPEKAIKIYDTNSDGVLSEVERKEMNEAFVSKFDTDGDNKLNATERSSARKNAKVKVSVNSKAPLTIENAQNFISRMDKDGDRSLSPSEVDEIRWKVLRRADSNRDGKITAEEWLASRS